MIEHDCRTCLFFDRCTHRMACENFTPAGDDAEDEALDTYIEEQRIEFREEWYQYTSEDFE